LRQISNELSLGFRFTTFCHGGMNQKGQKRLFRLCVHHGESMSQSGHQKFIQPIELEPMFRI
jgi:hypothetical protein